MIADEMSCRPRGRPCAAAAPGWHKREHGVSMVHARLRDALIRGELEAGQVLSQVQLAERSGVSRTPLREALRLLEREGLVVSEPRRRVRVAPFSMEDLEQIYAVRISLEILALRLTVPRLTDEAIAHIADLEQTMRRHAENRDYDAWHEPHRARCATGTFALPAWPWLATTRGWR
ncbi:GntR family transcriptional regulator [Nonomuraea phyllanthi]|nr:GntR family transcriptional regulator [Nonomuraea phyllanthi]